MKKYVIVARVSEIREFTVESENEATAIEAVKNQIHPTELTVTYRIEEIKTPVITRPKKPDAFSIPFEPNFEQKLDKKEE